MVWKHLQAQAGSCKHFLICPWVAKSEADDTFTSAAANLSILETKNWSPASEPCPVRRTYSALLHAHTVKTPPEVLPLLYPDICRYEKKKSHHFSSRMDLSKSEAEHYKKKLCISYLMLCFGCYEFEFFHFYICSSICCFSAHPTCTESYIPSVNVTMSSTLYTCPVL